MKYYGIEKKLKKEELVYFYAKKRTKILSLLPGKRHEYWKNNYKWIYENEYYHKPDSNSIPENNTYQLCSLVVADLIRREDIGKLQKGVRILLKKRRSNRFLVAPHEGLDEICKKIEQMDASLLSWYNTMDCGHFEFKDHPLEKSIAYFSMKISNVNSGYLSLIFDIHISREKQEKLSQLIYNSYDDVRGYAYQTMTGRRDRTGAFKSYSITHFNSDFLKADRIYEFLSYIEWEFFNELEKIFPFVLHKRSIMPPRLEIYSTSIDYHEDNRHFWDSVGVSSYQGQFIDERHKMFYENQLSGRYGNLCRNNRLIYIFKDDKIEIGQLKSIKDTVYFHVKEYAIDYFKFMFLDILSRETGRILIEYKHKLDKIKLKKNHLNAILKLKYNLSLEIDDYSRYKRDDIWSKAEKNLDKVYKHNDLVAELASDSFFISHSDFCQGTISESMEIDKDIDVVLTELEEKKNILQNLSDYKNTAKSIRLNLITVLLTALTLIFVIFPDKAQDLATFIIFIWKLILGIFL